MVGARLNAGRLSGVRTADRIHAVGAGIQVEAAPPHRLLQIALAG